ncbi:MAG TPA: hypothetical protein VFD72_02830 [Sphingobacteriaceae bacterium]|nr:hypothetical protein [Sphingobacteriaceae bacterium]
MQNAKKIDYTYTNSNLDNVEEDIQEEPVKRDTTKIYLFILAIVTLLATNVYFYTKYKTSEERAFSMNSERIYLQDEVDRIEGELNRLSSENAELSQALSISEDSVRLIIADLRATLEQQNLTQADLIEAQQEIDHLREEVFQYRESLSALARQNARLQNENETLIQEISSNQERVSSLEAENLNLSEQIKTAAVLKLSNINISGVRVRSGGRTEVENRARRVDHFNIVFNLADNPLVEQGEIDLFTRVIDPNGNLKTTENQIFELNGNPMQYTERHSIMFTNQGESYTMEWIDNQGFKKGTYTVVLYTENSTLGHSSIILN